MTLLSDNEIISTQSTTPLVTPFVLDNVRPASVELRLLNQVITKHPNGYGPGTDQARQWRTEITTWPDYGPLARGEVVAGRTIETLTVPQNLVAFVRLKRAWSARGLLMDAIELEPGFAGPVVLPLRNTDKEPVVLGAGFKIVHVFFEQLSSPATRTAP